MQALIFQYLTDTWGDIPYSEALKSDAEQQVLSPKYDAQKDIYAGLMASLTKVATDLAAPGSVTLGSADPIYAGSPAAWQRFANRLHARMALRLINVDRTTAASELQKALNGTGGVFRSNADNAVMRWPGDGVFNNSWSDNFKTRDDHRLSRTLINAMQDGGPDEIRGHAEPAARGFCEQVVEHRVPTRRAVLSGGNNLRELWWQRCVRAITGPDVPGAAVHQGGSGRAWYCRSRGWTGGWLLPRCRDGVAGAVGCRLRGDHGVPRQRERRV